MDRSFKVDDFTHSNGTSLTVVATGSSLVLEIDWVAEDVGGNLRKEMLYVTKEIAVAATGS